ncbi:MAG TPA: 50S ribosomal protein L29 [Thermoanaerobaculia bacterium]|jgi:large subunit ribosomal protein L29
MKSSRSTADLREKTPDELHTRQRELSEQLFKLRFQRATGRIESPAKMRQVRREIARIKTLLNEKARA